MTSFERSVLIFVVYLTIFYNIERVDFGQENVIDISSVIYVMILLAVLAIFLVPAISRIKAPWLIILWIGLYVLVRLAISPLYHRPLWGGIYTYLTTTEISLSAIAILLARDVRQHMDDVKQAIENITLAGFSNRVQHKDEAFDDIQKEFLRSRRHKYPLSAIVIQPDPTSVNISLNRSVLEIQKAMMSRYATTNVKRLASRMLRRTDLIIDRVIDNDSFVILLPDTDATKASQLGERFQNLVQSSLGIRIDYGLATFPDEALTFDELVVQADQKLQSRVSEVEKESEVDALPNPHPPSV